MCGSVRKDGQRVDPGVQQRPEGGFRGFTGKERLDAALVIAEAQRLALDRRFDLVAGFEEGRLPGGNPPCTVSTSTFACPSRPARPAASPVCSTAWARRRNRSGSAAQKGASRSDRRWRWPRLRVRPGKVKTLRPDCARQPAAASRSGALFQPAAGPGALRYRPARTASARWPE